MAITLTDLAKTCGTINARGIQMKLYLAFKSDVSAIPAASAHVVSTAITMAQGKTFVEVEISKNDKSYESKPEGNEDGSIYKTLIKGFHPSLRSAATNVLAGATNGCEIIAISGDLNGNYRIIGNLTEGGATLRASEINDNSKNGYELEIEWESALPGLFYTATIPS
jgi:hypothetical protein